MVGCYGRCCFTEVKCSPFTFPSRRQVLAFLMMIISLNSNKIKSLNYSRMSGCGGCLCGCFSDCLCRSTSIMIISYNLQKEKKKGKKRTKRYDSVFFIPRWDQ